MSVSATSGLRRKAEVHHFPDAVVADQIEMVEPAIGHFTAAPHVKPRPHHRHVAIDFDHGIVDALVERTLGCDALRKLGPTLRPDAARPRAAHARRGYPPVGKDVREHLL